MTISEEELFGALMELKEASQAMVEAQHGNDQDIWAISDRYDPYGIGPGGACGVGEQQGEEVKGCLICRQKAISRYEPRSFV